MLAASPDREKKGGVSGHVFNLTKWLSRQEGVDVTLLCFGAADGTEEVNGCRVVTLRKRRMQKLLPFVPLLRIRKVVRRVRPEVIHVQGSVLSYPLLYAMLVARRGLPKVITVHGHPVEEGLVAGWLKEGSFRSRMMSWAEKELPSRFDTIITVTARMKDDLRARYRTYAETEITTIPNGVDPEEFHAKALKQDVALAGILPRRECLTILNAKALSAFNGQEYLIRAFKIVASTVPDSRLLLFGTGPDIERLTNLTGQLGLSDKVHFLGHVQNELMPDILSMTDVVVLPSVRIGGVEEGSSLGLIEAMACSRPVVASSVGGSLESIRNEEDGILVPERDPEAIAHAVLTIHGNPALAARLGDAAREYVLANRTWDKIAARYVEVYRRAIDGR